MTVDNKILNTEIKELDLSLRTKYALKYLEIETVRDLLSITKNFLQSKSVGKRTLAEIEDFLNENEWEFNMEYTSILTEEEPRKKIKETSIRRLKISKNLKKLLIDKGEPKSLKDLVKYTKDYYLSLPLSSYKLVEELENFLKSEGLSFSETNPSTVGFVYLTIRDKILLEDRSYMIEEKIEASKNFKEGDRWPFLVTPHECRLMLTRIRRSTKRLYKDKYILPNERTYDLKVINVDFRELQFLKEVEHVKIDNKRVIIKV
jgi:hypothetical protein